MTLPVTNLEQRIAHALAEQLGSTDDFAGELVRDCMVNGPDSVHWDTVRPAAVDILKPYLDAMLPIVRMVIQALAPLLKAPGAGTTTTEHIGHGLAYVKRYSPQGDISPPAWYENGGRLHADRDEQQGDTAAATP